VTFDELVDELRRRLLHVNTPPPEMAKSVIEAHLRSDYDDRWLSIATVALAQLHITLD
jgi:2'-5' RNA ligase